MAPPVFISYARSTSRDHAEALQRALGDDLAFLDTSGVELGQRFPVVLADALLGSRVVVVFADETYFRRWFCLLELRTALAPFLALPPDASDTDKALALAPIVLALPTAGNPSAGLDRLPPRLRDTQWPRADQITQLAQWIRSCLAGELLPLGQRLEKLGRREEIRSRLLQESALPPPLMPPPGLRLRPVELPPSIGASFVGREDELWRIDFALSTASAGEGSAAALSGALEAAGGFGKTRLALEYLHRFGPRRFPGGLFWVDADASDERLEEQHHDFLSTLSPDIPSLHAFREQKRNAARELARALHQISASKPILYVVDNVPEPAPGQGMKPLKTWCPAIGKVALLITSRAKVSLGTEGIQSLPVSTLALDAAVALLTEEVGRAGLEASGWKLIAEWVGHLPMALELLNRAMRAGAMTPAELLDRAKHVGPALELDRQMEALRRHVPEGQLRGITEALLISYERLSPEAQRAASLLAQLSPAPLPSALLDTMGPLFPAPVRAMLTARCFVTGATGGKTPSFGGMHRVLADFIRSRSSMPDREKSTLGVALAQLMGPSACSNPEAWPLMEACQPHADWLFNRLTPSSQPEIGIALGLRLVALRSATGLVAQATETARTTLGRARGSLGLEHPIALVAMNTLGDALRMHGELHEARTLLEEALVVHVRVLGEDSEGTCTVRNNLALVLAELGDPRAQELAEHTVEARLQSLGDEDPQTLISMGNLATMLTDRGDLPGARALQEKVLAAHRRILGEEHPDTLLSMGNLACTLRRQGEMAVARAMQEGLVKTCRRVLGQEHPTTLMTMMNLGATLLSQTDFTAARALLEEALGLASRILGGDHLRTLDLKTNLAHTYRALGELAAARALYEDVLRRRRAILGESHPATIKSWENISAMLMASQQLQHANIVAKERLDAARRHSSDRDPVTVAAAWSLFCVYDHQDDFVAARAILNRHLLWLLDQPPASLAPDLRKHRESVAKLLSKPGPYATGPF